MIFWVGHPQVHFMISSLLQLPLTIMFWDVRRKWVIKIMRY